MFARALLVVLLLCTLCARPSSADPASEHLDAFIARLETFAAQVDPDDPDLKKQRKVLKKVQKKLKKKSASLATDALLAGKLAKLIAKGGPLFEDLADEIAAAMGDIRDNTESLIENIQFRVDALPDSKFKRKAQKSSAKLTAILADVDASDLKALGKALSAALVERRKTAKLVKKAEALIEEL